MEDVRIYVNFYILDVIMLLVYGKEVEEYYLYLRVGYK